METMTLEAGTLAYVRATGPFAEVLGPACNQLYAWAGKHGYVQNPCLFLYLDDPNSTPAEKCRTDVSLLVPADAEIEEGIEKQPFVGGKYAFIRKVIKDKSEYAVAWQQLMEGACQLELNCNQPPFEFYHSYDPETEVADVSFCISIK